MATPNFAYQNILLAADPQEDFEYADLQSNLSAELGVYGFTPVDYFESNGNRSYPKRIIAEYVVTSTNKRTVKLLVRIGDGYYSGVNVDYIVNAHDEIGGFDIDDYEPNATEQLKIKVAERKLRKAAEYAGFEPLIHVATFSNGEAIYERPKALLHGTN